MSGRKRAMLVKAAFFFAGCATMWVYIHTDVTAIVKLTACVAATQVPDNGAKIVTQYTSEALS